MLHAVFHRCDFQRLKSAVPFPSWREIVIDRGRVLFDTKIRGKRISGRVEKQRGWMNEPERGKIVLRPTSGERSTLPGRRQNCQDFGNRERGRDEREVSTGQLPFSGSIQRLGARKIFTLPFDYSSLSQREMCSGFMHYTPMYSMHIPMCLLLEFYSCTFLFLLCFFFLFLSF